MAKKAQDVYQDALALSEPEREELLRLLAAQHDGGFASPEIEQAWMQEIARRETLHAEGRMGSVSWKQLRRDLLERYRP